MSARRYHVERSIAAPPEVVWGLLTDASSYAAWNPAVIRIEGPITPGGTIRLVSIADPGRTFKLRVVEMTAPRRMVWSSGMPLGLFTGERTYELAASGSGTDFSMTEEFRGPLSGLIARSIPDLTDSFEQFAGGLAAASEAA